VVSAEEADIQAVRTCHDTNSIVVTGDSDIVAYGHLVVVVEQWRAGVEFFRVFDP
jgi:hypothetical protein